MYRETGDEVEDVQLEGSLTMRGVGIDVHHGASRDTQHCDGSSEHVSGDSGEGYLIVRCDCSPDVDIEAGMGPGEDELHAFPAQKLSRAQEAKDLDLKELAEYALIPGRQRMPDTVRDTALWAALESSVKSFRS